MYILILTCCPMMLALKTLYTNCTVFYPGTTLLRNAARR